jgi:hypothetical protein
MDRALGAELVTLLASLANQSDDAVEVFLSAQPKAVLLKLISIRVIDPVPAMSDEGYAIVLTGRGKEIIQQCAEAEPASDQLARENVAAAELERAHRERRSHVGVESSASAPRHADARPVAAWLEANAGLLQAVGIVVGIVVAVVIAILTT